MHNRKLSLSCFWFLVIFVLAMSGMPRAQNNGNGKGKPNGKVDCTINGVYIKSCTAGQLKQAAREAARQNAGIQQKGVSKKFAGVSPSTASLSPLAAQATLATMAAPGTPPDYFAAGHYANSAFPVVSATGTLSGGIRKFVDTLPGICGVSPWGTLGANGLGQCIPLATPDTATFPGSDFYRIGATDYREQMHSDLPGPFNTATPGALGTKLRGYVQLDSNNVAIGTPQYLGPLILATRNRPVRVMFKNMFSGQLSTPVDITYSGSGPIADSSGHSVAVASENRATLHLHGGNSPWISDGTTHQWITPANDPQGVANPFPGIAKGFSFQNVPDMVGPTSPIGLTAPSLTDGLGTFYWTNQQSGRLMFYHEHAFGQTRLAVYNGVAAGYLLADPAEETALAAATAPGTIVTDPLTGAIVTADLAHVIPLVIQDRTFVPDDGSQPGSQLAAQDPTWDLTRGSVGDLWFPHVYVPNQNPADITGANGFGRWDYGPWFWPPQDPATFVAGGMPYPCSSAATPAAGWAFPPLMCPGTPLPSGTPEGFMDTPVVNGTAYPTITVDPTAYRFQVLNAANDRALNLGLYVADPLAISVTVAGSGYAPPPALPPVVTVNGCTAATATAMVDLTGAVIAINVTYPATGPACTAPVTVTIDPPPAGTQAFAIASLNTEVKMVPAIPASAGRVMPTCAMDPGLALAGGGQVTSTLTTKTGLPVGCWPVYASAQGYTAGSFGEQGVLSWGNSDARIGGVPDPNTAGPPIIQIGAEGGVLPQIAVIPSTPVSFDYNKRSITVLNVLNHGLWLGPAERADIIVDFSQFAGQTLIVYNDSPAPVPAGDPRIDYFTNDPDMSSSGGAPTTMAGYGPNTRTIMQIVVNAGTPSSTFNVATLAAAVSGPTGIFASTQDPVIVPESAYPVGHGNGPDTYLPIQATSLSAWIGGPVGGLTLTSGGAGYTATPNVLITGGGGTGAQATATLATAAVASVNLSNTGGFGYTAIPGVSLTGGGGTGAAATAATGNGGVRSITVTAGGSGYLTAPTVVIGPPNAPTCPTGCLQATATATVGTTGQRRVTGIAVTNPGSGYISVPAVQFQGGSGGTGAAATAALGFRVTGFTVNPGGSGYSSAPTVTVTAPPSGNCVPASLCTAATATASLAPRTVASVTLTNGGTGYTSVPTVTFDPPQTAGSTATAVASAPSTPLLPKTIQELFTLDYGRMNATLGVELPFTNFLTQTTIPYGYADPPTEIFKDGETQLWKITHNGVDTHFIHFHLFTVQIINRVGWDGAIKPPDPYEMGLKDTVRMNPLEDIIVALRPFKQTLPWAVPSSKRPMDVTRPIGTTGNWFTNVDPTNQPATVINSVINFGWEFVWHCHILGHEENDMMRAMILAIAPAQPSVAAVTGASKGTITLTMSAPIGAANIADPTGFTISRSTSQTGPFAQVATVPAIIGTSATATFTDRNLNSRTTYFYKVVSSNLVGDTATYAAPAVGYPNVSADSAATAASAVAR